MGPEGPPLDAGWSRQSVVRGEVVALDYGAGTITVASEGERRTLRATPDLLRGVSPGQAVALPFRVFGSEAWVSPRSAGEPSASWAIRGTLAGPVARVDRVRGLLTIGDITFRSHPAYLLGVAPGERVAVEFANVGGADWVLSVAPSLVH